MKLRSEYFLQNKAKSLIPEFLGILCAFVALALASYLGYLMTTEPVIGVSDYLQLLALVVIAATLAFSVYVQRQKEKLEESQAYLEASIDLIYKAYDVLNAHGEGLTADRISWVTAARLLTRSGDLASRIALRSHKTIYESEHDFQRHQFGNLLKLDGKPLPVEFFMGNGHVVNDIGKSAFSTISVSGDSWIPIRIVATVYRFRSFPEGYEDPLESSRGFAREELDRLWLFDDQGVHDYDVFRKKFFSAGRSIYYKEESSGSREVSESEITDLMRTISGLEVE